MKFLKAFKLSVITLISGLLILMVYGFYTVPDELYKITGEELKVNDLFTVRFEDSAETSYNTRALTKEGCYNADIRLFKAIPIKSSKITVGKRHYTVVGGDIFGLRIYTDGVLVVGTQEIETTNGKINPAEKAGIKKGDVIVSINGEKIFNCAKLSDILSQNVEKVFTIVIRRSGKEYTVSLKTVFSSAEQKYRAGLWIRDSAAGIGTVTFYDKVTGLFAGLGHAVCDADTGCILPMQYGDTVLATICGCYKGKSGQAGELCGTFSSKTTGVLLLNSDIGVYGCFSLQMKKTALTPVALQEEVKTGKAQIISTVDESGPQSYEINIIKIDKNDGAHRNMIIEVTDKKLLEKTGGIVQGMSGSPIIQNGMLVGAITHVFVNDPTKGYAIFASDMMEQMLAIEQQKAG